MQNTVIDIEGMHSEGCAGLVQTALYNTAGVNRVSVSLLTNQASVQFDERHASPDTLARALAAAGYPATVKAAAGCCGGCCGG